MFDRREKSELEYRLLLHDEEYRWIFVTAIPRFNEDRSFAGYVGVGLDVTHRKHAEQERDRALERLRLAMKSGSPGLGIWAL